MDEDRTAAQTSDRLNARDYKVNYMDNDRPHLLLDVRSRPETEICKLPNSRNIPIDDIDKNLERIRSEVSILPPVKNKKRVVVCCRRGNDSKSAVIKLRAHFKVCSLLTPYFYDLSRYHIPSGAEREQRDSRSAHYSH